MSNRNMLIEKYGALYCQVTHIKTGKTYFMCDIVTNTTNEYYGQAMVLYYSMTGIRFVREFNEFIEKFERYKEEETDGQENA